MKVLKEHYKIKFILDEGIILEGIDDVRPYYPNIDEDKFNQLIALDPTFKGGKDKLGTYGKWILNLYDKKRLKDEDFYKVTEYLTEFERKRKNFKNKDIGQFKTLPDLADALAEVEDAVPTERQVRRNSTKNKEYDVVFDDDQFTVYIPKTYGASRELGGDTHWCTASSDDYYYNWYTEEGPLYIIISKNDTRNKWQVHFPSGQCMNASDRPTDLVEVCRKDLSLLNFFTKVATDYLSENDIDVNTDMILDMTKVDTDDLVVEWIRGKGYSYRQGYLSEEILRAFFDAIVHDNSESLFDICIDWAYDDLNYYESDTRKGMSFRKGVLERWAEENNISIEDAEALIRGDYDEVEDETISTDQFDDDIRTELASRIEESYYDNVISYIGSHLASGLSDVTNWDSGDYDFSKIPVFASNNSNNIIDMALSYGQGTWDSDSYFEVTGNPIYDSLLQQWGEKSVLIAPYYGFDRDIDDEEILAGLSVYRPQSK